MNGEKMNIQWYPGHMTKTRRQMEADLKQVDAVCEILKMNGYTVLERSSDYNARERAVIAQLGRKED